VAEMSGGEKEYHVGLMVVCVLIGKGMPLGREVVGFLFVLVTVWPREVRKWVFGFVPVLSDSEGERYNHMHSISTMGKLLM